MDPYKFLFDNRKKVSWSMILSASLDRAAIVVEKY
jgi:hypothetical protein